MGPSAATSLSEADLDFLVGQTTSLVEFATRSVHPDGGFAWLDDEGRPLLDRPVELWISCRMLHVLALAEILGDSSLAPLVDSGVAALTGRLRDGEYTGWFASVSSAPDTLGSEAGSEAGSTPVDDSKQTYAHAFVVLAAASAAAAGHEAARPLLDEALVVFDRHLWQAADGMVVDGWNRAFTELDPYRGVNANMHTVEALLAAHDVTGDEIHLQRALTITSRVVHSFAAGNGYRLPEHYDEQWQAIPDYNRDQPRDRFRPYGVTIGHLLEWARLALHVRSALEREGIPTPDWLLADATALFERAVEDGWQQSSDNISDNTTDNTTEGFVYTTDFDANPVVPDRLHWVVAEAIATAWTLALLTGDPAYRQWFDRWVEHARTYFVDEVHGSWHHELDEQNHPSSNVWEGKPDVYHAYQAMLLPRLGEVTSFVDGATRLVP
ncbi:AGE family epimerase/isomerase [Lapillicoccus sp.]|uniref:AGE family epimerase/isomerase n=1 Tax=Lapillicoccus sp. TaxID=1909287 RepID=UPI0032643AC4